MASPTVDLAMAPVLPVVTIRDLNNGRVPTGTQVKFNGVIIGPMAYIEIGHDKMSCDYNTFVAQPDPSPTLQDGIEVLFSKPEATTGDMGLSITYCTQAGSNESVTKLMIGHAVEVTGTFTVTPSGDREVVVATGANIVDQGDARTPPSVSDDSPPWFYKAARN